MKAALYTRISTVSPSRRGEELVSIREPEMQEELLRTLAERCGWSVTRVYTDPISGAIDVRPGLTEMLADARRARFDVVVVWRFDRLSRSVPHFLNTVDELQGLASKSFRMSKTSTQRRQ